MGEVYRARDARLDREVAIKILPAAVADDADRRARFEREAKAVAALSHPNILAIHDVGADPATGLSYAVTELLQGETLRQRIAQGPLPVRKAIEVAVQIARGLAAAHDRGIVHRDLKPDNVFLLKDGQVKILDFGLARQVVSAGSGATSTVAAVTDPGTVMGTVGYMAPEQVRGEAIDGRTDLFAFGAVLYEMLSGRRAFQRGTAAETMTAVLREDPADLSGQVAELSPSLDRIVRHCLEKNPGERFQSARDVAFALEALSGSGSTTAATARVARPSPRWAPIAAALVAGLALGAAAAVRLAPSEAPYTFETKTWDAQWITNARFTPDAQTLLFSAARDGNTPLVYAIRPGSFVSQPIGEPATQLLSVSKKNDLAVLTGANLLGHRVFSGTLARMTLDGASRAILEHVTEADWAPDGETLAVVHVVNGRSQLEYPIGTKLFDTAGYVSDPRVSPDGQRVAFFDHLIPLDDRGWVKVVDKAGKVTTVAGEYGSLEGLAWYPDGKSLLFSVSEGGDDRPFVADADGRTPAHLAISSAGSVLVLDISPAGHVLAVREEIRHSIRGQAPGFDGEREFSWLDFVVGGSFSPDGKLLTFSDLSQSAGTDYMVSVRRTDGSPVVRLGPGAGLPMSPDATWVLALIPSKQQLLLYPTGAGSPVLLDRGAIASYRYVAQWFADGKHVLFCGTETSGASRCYQQAIAGGPPAPIAPEGTLEAYLAGDDQTLLIVRNDGTLLIGALGSDARRAVTGFDAGDQILGFSRDRRAIFVQAGTTVPVRVVRVDLSTGARTLMKELAPPDRAGVTGVSVDQWDDDGQRYTYRYLRSLSTLYVASR